jgi:excisionase family DNA binding protein
MGNRDEVLNRIESLVKLQLSTLNEILILLSRLKNNSNSISIDTDETKYLTLKEACSLLKITPPTLRKLIRAGLLPYVRVGAKKKLIPVSALSALQEKQQS